MRTKNLWISLAIILITFVFELNLVLFDVSEFVFRTVFTITVILLAFISREYLIKSRERLFGLPIEHSFLLLGHLAVTSLALFSGGWQTSYFWVIYVFVLVVAVLGRFMQSFVALFTVTAVLVVQEVQYYSKLDMYGSWFWLFLPLVVMFIFLPSFHYLVRITNLRARTLLLLRQRFGVVLNGQANLIESVKEMVIVTNHRLRVVSLNQDARAVLDTTIPEVLSRSIFQVVRLVGPGGKSLDHENALGIDLVRQQCVPQIISKVQVYSGVRNLILEMDLQISPICDDKGKVNQYVFSFTPWVEGDHDETISQKLSKVMIQHQELLKGLRLELAKNASPLQIQSLERFSEVERDLLTIVEVDELLGAEPFEVVDVVNLMQLVVKNTIRFARSFNVIVESDSVKNTILPYSFRTPGGVDVTWRPGSSSGATVLTQAKWLRIVLQKIIDTAILLTAQQNNGKVKIAYQISDEKVEVDVISQFRELSSKEAKALFEREHGHLGKTSFLHLGSGLEGYLAKRISDHLGYELKADSYGNPPTFGFNLKVWRNPR